MDTTNRDISFQKFNKQTVMQDLIKCLRGIKKHYGRWAQPDVGTICMI